MPQFAYKAMQHDGVLTEGILDASNRQEAMRQVEGRGLRPIKLAESGSGGAAPKKSSAARASEKNGANGSTSADAAASSGGVAEVQTCSRAHCTGGGPESLSRSAGSRFR
jgi:hypothetical protein